MWPMSEPVPPRGDAAPPPAGGGSPPGPPRLARAPGARYEAPAAPAVAAPGSPARAVLGAVAVAAAAALVVFALGLVDVGAGLLAVAAMTGWATALGLHWGGGGEGIARPGTRAALAAVLAGGAVAGGLLANWAWSLAEGGALDPLGYLAARYGLPLAAAFVAVAAAAGALRGRGRA